MVKSVPGQPPGRQHEHEADRLQRERDPHRQLASDAVRRPAPEDPAAAVGERVERRRRRPARAAGMPHDAAIGPALAVTSRPPVAIITNIA